MYENTFDPSPLPPPPNSGRQSKLGVASLAVGIISLVFFCIGFVIAFGYGISISVSDPLNPQIDPGSNIILIASGIMCVSPLISLVGIGFGIASVLQKTDKKTLGIIGLVMNGLIFITYCGLSVLGLVGGMGSLGL